MQAFGISDFDDDLKDAISDTETIIIDGDRQSLFDVVQYCDAEKMYRRIINSDILDSTVSLKSITGSNIDLNGNDDDTGEAAFSSGCASHYFPSGVENPSVQTSSGSSIVDNDSSQTDEGSTAKIL